MRPEVDAKSFNSLTRDELVLVNYIKQARAQGMPNHQVTLELMKAGWTNNNIAAAFQKVYLLSSNEYTTQPHIEITLSAFHLLGLIGWPLMSGFIILVSIMAGRVLFAACLSIAFVLIPLLAWKISRLLALGASLGVIIILVVLGRGLSTVSY